MKRRGRADPTYHDYGHKWKRRGCMDDDTVYTTSEDEHKHTDGAFQDNTILQTPLLFIEQICVFSTQNPSINSLPRINR
ncbi:hypothetical protein BLNAU_16010 [Blattamonas nauphoetae]|uniref:Uncharacterized protein n=1 Tax=Blattamonas nauphoetae TaxID=2049346 RepID=A0ABQ9XCE1_9EUKA|nr:hypothetical protein BLNAU_16010 [Blattamonas nauphoetae]